MACHLQSDASACWSPITVTDGDGRHFYTSGHSGTHLDRDSGHLFIYANRTADQTVGVVCFDTRSPQASPFCGFTPLTSAGDGNNAISGPALVGDRWYAFNYFPGATATGDRNRVLCFDVARQAPCTSQPYSLDLGSLPLQGGAWPPPALTGIDGRCWFRTRRLRATTSHASTTSPGSLARERGRSCSRRPTPHGTARPSPFSAPLGRPSASAGRTGWCRATTLKDSRCRLRAGWPLRSAHRRGGTAQQRPLARASMFRTATTTQLTATTRSAAATCAGFPKAFNGLSLLYTVNVDPDRPTCLWVNADTGAAQIQNFEAYSEGWCGQGPIRVLASSFVIDTALCQPATYTSLAIQSPPRDSYATGTVSFQDASGTSIAGGATADLDQSGVADLSGFNLTTALGLPHFLIVLEGAQGDPTEVMVKLTWKGANETSCVKPWNHRRNGPGVRVPGPAVHRSPRFWAIR